MAQNKIQRNFGLSSIKAMSVAFTALKQEVKIDETHRVDTNCDFTKTIYIARIIEKFGESFPDWIQEIIRVDITDSTIHGDEYLKFMKIGN